MIHFNLCTSQSDRAHYDEAVERFARDAVRNAGNYDLTDKAVDAYYDQFTAGIGIDDEREARIRFDSQFRNTWAAESPSWAK